MAEIAKSPHRKLKSFNQCILRFPDIKRSFVCIRSVFNAFDANGDGSIDRTELLNTMRALGAACSEKDLLIIFKGSDLTHQKKLGFKHFLLCLCLASVLELFPTIHVNDHEEASEAAEGHSEHPDGEPGNLASRAHEEEDTGSILQKGRLMAKGLRYVVEAYILFDQDGSGSIDRKEVMALIAERSDKEGKNGLLSADRWKELDWDSDGSITFKEFVAAMYEWVDAGSMDD